MIPLGPVWVNGKLVTPKGWISPQTRELMAKAQADCVAAQKAMREGRDELSAETGKGETAQRPDTADRWPKDMR